MTVDSPRTVLVVPCHNEADRLRPADIHALVECPGLEVVLVDDGSTDATASLLGQLAGSLDQVSIHSLHTNSGKAEAVRQGLLVAVDHEPDWVGFCDADMATPVSEILRLNDIATTTPGVSVILASRVGLLGYNIQRLAVRHYRGRFFATVAATILGIPVYDTQCGAKFFRNTDALRVALSEPFHSRWSFDVELLGRLLRGRGGVEPMTVDEFLEVPLKEWFDVPGSKIGAFASVTAGLELGLIAHHLRRW
jgi:glycosyltransferase involved in cell wall biosynthesis